MINRKFLILLLLCLLCLLTSCKMKPSSVLAQDSVCSPPCWKGIVPGKASKDQVLAQLSQLSEVRQDTIEDVSQSSDDSSNHYFWKFADDAGDVYGSIFYSDNVQLIEIGTKNLRLGDVIERFGEPDSVVAFSLAPHTSNIFFTYREKGMIFIKIGGYKRPGEQEKLHKNIQIDGVYYFAPDYYEELFTTGNLGGLYSTLSKAEVWKGYGDVTYVAHELDFPSK